jgi:group I intron endonuclease
MEAILDDPSSIQGIIYLIEHSTSGKKYIGQTLSHRKNHDRYRPFGAIGRFRDHISEALNNTKHKQCTYLNNAIRLYGAEAFTVRILEVCERDDLDQRERHYISAYSSLYPYGYNLTPGGKGVSHITISNDSPLNPPKAKGGCTFRSHETRQKMSDRHKDRGFTDEERRNRMSQAQGQHEAQKLERFRNVLVDPTAIDQYIEKRKGCVVVSVDGIKARFVGKYESEGTLHQKARDFLLNVHQATLPNCSGNP